MCVCAGVIDSEKHEGFKPLFQRSLGVMMFLNLGYYFSQPSRTAAIYDLPHYSVDIWFLERLSALM